MGTVARLAVSISKTLFIEHALVGRKRLRSILVAEKGADWRELQLNANRKRLDQDARLCYQHMHSPM
eukprot:9167982-Pyramimonas_sp.AAC.1